MTELWDHQLETKAAKSNSPILFDASDPGTGKTLAHLSYVNEKQHCTLVICPRTLMEPAWGQDIRTFYPDMAYSTCFAANREEGFAADAQVYITNTDAVRWLIKKPPSFFKRFKQLIIDESTTYKNPTRKRTKAMMKLADHFEERVCMSGTPITKTVLDIWAQAYILDQGERLGTSYYKFRLQCCIPKRVGAHAGAVKWEDKEGIEMDIMEMLSDITIRHRIDECMDIPPNHIHWVKFDMPKNARAQYRTLARDAVLTFRSEKETEAANAAVLQNKLLQLSSGAVYTSGSDIDHEYELIDTTRYELIIDLIKDRAASLVFFNWHHQREQLILAARKAGIDFEMIDGTVNSDAKRAQICDDFQAGRYQVLFLHPKTAAHGLTLTRAKTVIWASPRFEPDLIKQGIARIVRGGQTDKTETIYVAARDTVDEYVYNTASDRVVRLDGVLKHMDEFCL